MATLFQFPERIPVAAIDRRNTDDDEKQKLRSLATLIRDIRRLEILLEQLRRQRDRETDALLAAEHLVTG